MDQVPAVVAHYINAYNEMDVDGMLRCLSDDVHFINRSNGEISAETNDIEAFGTLANQGVALFLRRKQSVTNCIAIAGHVTLRVDYTATIAVDLPNGWKAGQSIELEGASLFTLRNDKIAELVDIS